MDDPEEIFAAIEEELARTDQARERAIKGSREVIRLTKKVIKDIHSGAESGEGLAELDGAVSDMNEAVAGRPGLESSGIVEAALAEAAETYIFYRALKDEPLPAPGDISVTPAAYVLGAADAVGELRRAMMDALLEDDLDGARRLLGSMETLYDQVNRFNLPDAVLPVRRKQDAIRGILDRSRSLVVEAVENRRRTG